MARPRPDSLPVAALLTAVVAFGPVSTDLYLPSLPAMTRDFQVDVSMVQLTLSVFVAGFAVCQLIYGPLSDRFGRRPVLLGGIATFFAASIFCVFAPTIEALIVGRFLQAVGACAGPVLGRAVVRDVYPKEMAARVLSYMASAMGLMPAVAPMLGGLVFSLFGWRANFVVLALFGVALFIATLLMLEETNRQKDRHAIRPERIIGNYGRLLGDRRFLSNVLALAFGFAGLFGFISGSSFVLIDVLQVDPANFGFAFACVVVGYMSGSFISGRLGPRFGQDRLLRAGVLLGFLTALLMTGLAWAGIQTVPAVVGPASLFFLSVGLVLPNSTAAALSVFPTIAGSASGMLGFIQMTAGALSGWVVGRLHDGTTLPMAGTILFTSVLAMLAYLLRPARDG